MNVRSIPGSSDPVARIGSRKNRGQLSLFKARRRFVDVELFAGAGGMSLGLTEAGLSPDHLFEFNKHCFGTLRHNATGEDPWIVGEIHEDDVAEVRWEEKIKRQVRLLSAGPPCQPFSLAGKHLAERDDRNEFPSTLRAVRALRPAAILIENVHGLRRASFRPYLEYILRQLECPEVAPRHDELWDEHDKRIQQHQWSRDYAPEYNVTWGLLNAADFGVPQMRSRVIILATRIDLAAAQLPQPTHSMAALIRDQSHGDYWERHGLTPPEDREHPKGPPGYARDPTIERQAWSTIRDGLMGLPNPPPEEDVDGINHWFIPGARVYAKHNGSEPDWPSKTIKAGVHGVAGGENILRLSDSNFRYFTLREMARLQGFPDDFFFTGPRSRIIGQIGNAVPCRLARILGEQLKPALQDFERGLPAATDQDPVETRRELRA